VEKGRGEHPLAVPSALGMWDKCWGKWAGTVQTHLKAARQKSKERGTKLQLKAMQNLVHKKMGRRDRPFKLAFQKEGATNQKGCGFPVK